MPIYEYRCEACGETHDALQKVNDPHLTECPACGKPALKRLISAPAFRLKGSGWYETDFKSDKEKKRNLVDGAAGGGDKSADGDGKAAAKADTKSGDGAAAAGESKSAGGGKKDAGGSGSAASSKSSGKSSGGSEAA